MSLTTFLLLSQLLLPLALLGWCWFAPAPNRLGRIMQFAATGALLSWLGEVAVWTIPPWWLWYAYLGLWLLALARAVRGWRDATWLPATWPAWALTIAAAALGGYAIGETLAARRGHAPPAPPVALRFPLAEGRYLVLNGGDDLRINAHLESKISADPRYLPWRGNAYAVDLIAIDRFGLRADGLRPADNRRYRSFGRAVLAPCDGEVIVAVDGIADMTPPQYDIRARLAGNHLLLRCGSFDVALAHLRNGSLRVAVGARVRAGDALAELGNSGGSDEAHLHIQAQRPGPALAPMGGDPLPLAFFGRFPVRGDRYEVDAAGRLR